MHQELFEELAGSGHEVSAGQLGENITTRGLDVLNLPQGTRLAFGDGGAVVQVGSQQMRKAIEAARSKRGGAGRTPRSLGVLRPHGKTYFESRQGVLSSVRAAGPEHMCVINITPACAAYAEFYACKPKRSPSLCSEPSSHPISSAVPAECESDTEVVTNVCAFGQNKLRSNVASSHCCIAGDRAEAAVPPD